MLEASEDKLGAAGANGRKRGFMVGGHVPVGVGQIRFSLARDSKTSHTITEGRASQVSVGYVHNLRTALFATFSAIRNSNYMNAGASGYGVGSAGVSPNGSVKAQDIGIRHIF